VSRSLAACEGALLVVDASQVLNKIDLPGAEPDRVAREIEEVCEGYAPVLIIGLDCSTAIQCSAKEGIGITEILNAIVTRVPPPNDTSQSPLRALIFDSGKAPYRPVHTGLAADRYADRPLLGGTAKIDRRQLISVVDNRFRLLAKKYLIAVLACVLPARPRCTRVDRKPLPHSLPAGRPRDVAALTARGRLSSPRRERDRGDKKREKKKREKPVPRALLFPDSPCDPSPGRSVGYLSASIRSVADARVGDTITHFGRRAASSLPGYEKATPMVFCGLFPVDADQ
ncbi:hypothetical protein GW17_00000499, partial [Ensete ventricosum]